MNADGTDMHQISFNTNHDFAPSLLANGHIVFCAGKPPTATRSACTRANADGTGLQLLYGANSHATGANIAGTNNNVIQFLNARELANGKLVAIDRPLLGTQLGGDILSDQRPGHFVDIHQPFLHRPAPPGTGSRPASTTTSA